ncbi:MAG: hypothetical protein A3E85_04050 [Gammaproteobacteria bacterium RIFCSPHIGHO2_12_FULL_45_12]|nr:MAG: hypothetical protein A3E85_04050 [Gammaproteobacteria bacterium RIFCSPHIGHO2_12_FULL_45_12]
MENDEIEPNPPLKLPKLRNGLTFSFSDYDPDGKPQWLIHDAGRNKFFVIGWMEYEILIRWTLEEPQKIIDAILSETTLHVEMADIKHIAQFLIHNYLVQQSGYQIYKHAKSQKLFKDENILHWLVTYYLFFKIPLWHPNKFLSHTKQIGNLMFNKYVGYLMLALAFVAVYQIGLQWEEFTHTFSTIFTWTGLFFYFIAFSVCKFFHELGHAYMCKRYGIPVPTFGVAFLVFWPVLFTDTTLSWVLNSKQRMRIALAGIWMETYVTILAALVWCNTADTTIRSIAYVVITINWISSLLINVSPFMRFDGYYVLADFLKIPNLQARAFALTKWQIRRWLFDWPDPPPEHFSRRTHTILVIYSIATWLYRLVLYIGIAVLVYHFFIKILGIILFIVELFYFIFSPILTELIVWIKSRDRFSLNKRTIVTLIVFSMLLVISFLPIKTTVRLPATMSYSHQFLIAPAEGVMTSNLPKPGIRVKANQPIVTIVSADLDYTLKQIQMEYKKTLSELRRATIDPKYSSQQSALLSNITKQSSENHRYLELKNRLTLTVPFNGVVADIQPDLYMGAIVKKDEWIGDVVDPSVTVVEAFVTQADISKVKIGLIGHFYRGDLSEDGIKVKVKSIENLNANQLSCAYSSGIKGEGGEEAAVETPCYHSSEFGGSIATYQAPDGSLVPVDSVYRILLTTMVPVKLQHIERGSVFLRINSNSYVYRLFYAIKKILVEESGF